MKIATWKLKIFNMVDVQTKEKGKGKDLGLLERPPVVTLMGHVDHGKTSILDAIRSTNLAEKEHGGITQHIGAYQVDYKGQKITFIDTPGHSAFSAMRSRGAKVTDLVILVVAADDGVMPQTKESIEHIKSASVPFIVAVNKIDIVGADLNKVKGQLAENGVLVEGFGGDVVVVPVSAKTKQGIEELLEMIVLVSQISELKDRSKEAFQGVVIESYMDRFRGPIATVLVQAGLIKVGDLITTGKAKGKVRALKDTTGRVVKEATVSAPIEVMGLDAVPIVGELTKLAHSEEVRVSEQKRTSPTLRLFDLDKNEFRLIIKSDVEGSLEAIIGAIKELETPESRIDILLSQSGDINEGDVELAKGAKALILGFNVKIAPTAQRLAQEEGVSIRTYNIIYELLDELKLGIEALAKKEVIPEIKGRAEVRAIFEIKRQKIIGAQCLEGEIKRGGTIELLRNGERIAEAKILTMKHQKEDIEIAKKGQEFGITTKPPLEVAEGDIIRSCR